MISLILLTYCNEKTGRESKNNDIVDKNSNIIESKKNVVDNTNTTGSEKIYFYANVDNLNVRETPGLDGNIKYQLPEGLKVEYLNEKSKFKKQITLRGKEYNEPFLKIKKIDGISGWAYGGALSILSIESEQYTKEMESLLRKDNFGKSDLEKIKELLKQGAIVKLILNDWSRETPLVLAAGKGNPELIRILLENGANVNSLAENESGTPFERRYNALYIAARSRNIEVVRILIKAGGNINDKVNYAVCSPLAAAISTENSDIVKLLLNEGADPNSEEPGGETRAWSCLMHASYLGHYEIVKMLLDAGADPNICFVVVDTSGWPATYDCKDVDIELRIKNGSSALSLASNQEIIELLKNAGAKEFEDY